MPGFNGRAMTMPQFSHLSGGPKKLPDAPINDLPAPGANGGTKALTPNTKGLDAHESRATTGSKKGQY